MVRSKGGGGKGVKQEKGEWSEEREREGVGKRKGGRENGENEGRGRAW